MASEPLQSRINEALAARAEGREELAAELARLSVPELVAIPTHLWAQLGAAGRHAFLRAFNPEALSVAPAAISKFPSENDIASKPLPDAKRVWLWRRLHLAPVSATGLVAGVLVGLIAAAIATAAIGGMQTFYGWPSEVASTTTGICPRLSSNVDHCFYRVQRRLTWAQAASRLGIPESVLRQRNPLYRGVDALIRGETLTISR